MMPGYTQVFSDFWTSHVAMPIAQSTGSATAILKAGVDGLAGLLKARGIRFHQRTLDKILLWAELSSGDDPDAMLRGRFVGELEEDRIAKSLQIQALERDSAGDLVKTPYVLLMAIPGLNVVSIADFAGEMGPIEHYANDNAITGRAGLYPWAIKVTKWIIRMENSSAVPIDACVRQSCVWRTIWFVTIATSPLVPRCGGPAKRTNA